MKIYKCDACGKAIENPYEANMREFYVGVTSDASGIFPVNAKRKTKVHLCEECYSGLCKIAQKTEVEE